ncbi:MAG TPA: phosphatase PAP2 family protein [Gaiellaceae bacterium]|nr:phosphatase PAP2 family protein [Gaiellaceae bacterium]
MSFRARREVAIGLGTYAAYLLVRRRVWTDPGRERARRNGRRLLELERRLGIAIEAAVETRALRRPRLVHALDVAYGTLNVGLTVGWLIALYRRRDGEFHRLRRRVVAAHAGALPVFLVFPVAPPRAARYVAPEPAPRRLDLDHPVLVRFYNPVAALPSQHLSLAVVTGSALAARAGGRVERAAARTYPAVVALVVVATGNHYVVDVLAGAALGALARHVP